MSIHFNTPNCRPAIAEPVRNSNISVFFYFPFLQGASLAVTFAPKVFKLYAF